MITVIETLNYTERKRLERQLLQKFDIQSQTELPRVQYGLNMSLSGLRNENEAVQYGKYRFSGL